MKRQLLLLIFILLTKLTYAEFKSGAFKFGVGTIPSIVDSLADAHPTLGGDIGTTVFSKWDSQSYRWNGIAWMGRNVKDYARFYPTFDTMLNMMYTKGQVDSLEQSMYVLKTDTGFSGLLERRFKLDSAANKINLNSKATTASLILKTDTITTGFNLRRYLADSAIKTITLLTKLSSESQILSGSGNTINLTGGTSYTVPNQTYTSLTGKPTYDTVKIWSKSALLSNQGIIVTDTFSVTSATPTISLPLPTSTSQVKILAATGYRAGSSVNNSPQVSVSAMTSTTVSLILSQQSTATVSILGINVLSGLPIILVPDYQNIKIIISYIAY